MLNKPILPTPTESGDALRDEPLFSAAVLSAAAEEPVPEALRQLARELGRALQETAAPPPLN